MLVAQDKIRFEQLVLPHVDAAVNLARWLLRNPEDAEDVAQEAVLRAYRFFSGIPRRRPPRLVITDRAEQLLHLSGEAHAGGAGNGIK